MPTIMLPELRPMLDHAAGALRLTLDSAEVTPLAGDGSDRRFFRVRRGADHYVALISPRKNHQGLDENDSYLKIGEHLRRKGVPVPRIFWADAARGWFLLEDFGDRHLQAQVLRGRSSVTAVYRRALEVLVRLHREGRDGFRADYCFDGAFYDPAFVYERELEYFRSAFLVSLMRLEIDREDLRRDFERIAEAAGNGSDRFVFHRDFQSRNLMVCKGKLGLVDFQGMRFGPPAYDLASLLIDPYVALPARLQEVLSRLYWDDARKFLGGSIDAFLKHYRWVRLCRNLQILGAFGYLGTCKGKPRFLAYVPGAWAELTRLLREHFAGCFPRLEECVDTVARKAAFTFPTGGGQVFRDFAAAN